MWVRTTDNKIYYTHSEIRAAFPEISFPEILNEESIEFAGLAEIKIMPSPQYDPATHKLVENSPRIVDGEWVKDWDVVELTETEKVAYKKSLVPDSVTMRKGRITLHRAGLLSQVEAAISAIPDESVRTEAKIEWEYAQTIDRNSPFTLLLGNALNLTEDQLDDLFISANEI